VFLIQGRTLRTTGWDHTAQYTPHPHPHSPRRGTNLCCRRASFPRSQICPTCSSLRCPTTSARSLWTWSCGRAELTSPQFPLKQPRGLVLPHLPPTSSGSLLIVIFALSPASSAPCPLSQVRGGLPCPQPISLFLSPSLPGHPSL
jgi:hypothetical protein